MQNLSIDVTEVIKSDSLKVDADGAILNGSFLWDRTPKTELYHCPGCAENVANLSDKAQRLYLHILYAIQPKKDYLWLNAEYYMRRNGIKSRTTYSEAVKELIRYDFIIATHIRSVYWLNPWRFFPGSRVRQYPDRLRVKHIWDQTSL